MKIDSERLKKGIIDRQDESLAEERSGYWSGLEWTLDLVKALEAEQAEGEKCFNCSKPCESDICKHCGYPARNPAPPEVKLSNKEKAKRYEEFEDEVQSLYPPDPPEPPKMVSKCCGTDIEDMTANGYSGVYQCVNCGEMPCDLVSETKGEVQANG